MAESNFKNRQVTIRLDEPTYFALKVMAEKRGESMTVVARRILSASMQSNNALDASDILITTVRKAVARELRQTENRLGSICAKAAIASASNEVLSTRVLKLLNEPNLLAVRDEARKRGVAFIREPLDQIMKAYQEDNIEDNQ